MTRGAVNLAVEGRVVVPPTRAAATDPLEAVAADLPADLQHTVTAAEAGERLDRVVERCSAELSRSRIKTLVEQGLVWVDDRPASKAGERVRVGQRVWVQVPPIAPSAALAQDIPLQVRFEDDQVLVVSKPAGLVVHPARGNLTGTLVNAVLHHCPDLAGVGDSHRPGIVHRLDKDTSGLMVVAKTDRAHRSLAAQLKSRAMGRRYLALVLGTTVADEGTFDTPFGRHPTDRLRFTSRGNHPRRAVTRWQVLQRGALSSLVAVRLETGRTHQIRVHFADHGHPVAGDPLYGRQVQAPYRAPTEAAAIASLRAQALHAAILAFDHPLTGARVVLAEPPGGELAAAIARALPSAMEVVARWLEDSTQELTLPHLPMSAEGRR
ncbi:MAG: hypothetical protein AMXMBFR64_25820 [Myxococcales bacterium]